MDNFKYFSKIKKRNILTNINNNQKNKILQSQNSNHFKYQKLYNISEPKDYSKIKESEKIRIKSKYKKKYEILKKVFKNPKKSNIQNLAKLTKPQLPFTSRKKIDPETKRRKIISSKPSSKYHDFYTVKWLKNKYSNSMFEKSINTLLPDNGKPIIPKDESQEKKKHRIFLEFLESLKPVIDKEKNVNINPKYFFDKNTFEKVLKLKKIFLEFDEDGSRKMEIDEMFTMFNQNNIYADINELVNLFFQKKKYKKKEMMNLYLDFFQFLQFSLNKDQEFRNFMRKIKNKYQNGKDKSIYLEEGEKLYLPMSFDLILDLFIIKGKERSAYNVIKTSMNSIDNILYKGLKDDKNLFNLNLSIFDEKKRRKSLNLSQKRINNRLSTIRHEIKGSTSILKNDNSHSKNDNNNKKYESLENINFITPMNEFEKILIAYGVNSTKKSNKSNLKHNSYEKKISKLFNSTRNCILNENYTSFRENNKQIINNKDSLTGNIYKKFENKNIEITENNSFIADITKNYMNKQFLQNINAKNYDKYHNIKIAIDTSNKEIHSINNLKKNKSNKLKINCDDNCLKDNINYSSFNSFSKSAKLNNFNKNNKMINHITHTDLNPLIQYSSYFKKKSSLTRNKFPSNINKDFIVYNNFTEIGGNKSYNSLNKFHSKIKLMKHKSMDNYINKNKYDYVPLELIY